MNIGEAFGALPQTRIRNSRPGPHVFGKVEHEEAQDYVGSRVGAELDEAGLPVVRRGAAGIDLGSEEHWVCAQKTDVPGREVAKFGATTPELERMAAWLKERKVETVALESTGVYWSRRTRFWRGMDWKSCWWTRANWPECRDGRRRIGWTANGLATSDGLVSLSWIS
jgi:hypothetical protein